MSNVLSMRAAHPTQLMQMKQDKEAQKTYTGLVMIGAVAVLWIGVVLLMAEVHKNARPVFIVLGGVITAGLGYAWYDFNWKRESEKTGAEQEPFLPPGAAGAPGHPQFFSHGPGQTTVVGFHENKQFSKAEYDAAILKVRQEEERKVAEKEMELKQEREKSDFWKKQAEHHPYSYTLPPGPAVAPPGGGNSDLTPANLQKMQKMFEQAAKRLTGGGDDSHLTGVQKANKRKWEQNGWHKDGDKWKRDSQDGKYAKTEVAYTVDREPKSNELK